jgi:hypothetical protein
MQKADMPAVELMQDQGVALEPASLVGIVVDILLAAAGVIVTLGINGGLKGVVVDQPVRSPRPLDQSRVLLPSLFVGNDPRASSLRPSLSIRAWASASSRDRGCC